jgi:hypothetical protein
MNLKNGTTLFKELVRAPNLAAEVTTRNLMTTWHYCTDHGDMPHYYDDATDTPLCLDCIDQSRALAHIGRAGGRKGGRSLSPRKLSQLRAASESARVKAAERRNSKCPHGNVIPIGEDGECGCRVTRDETNKTGDSHE